MNCGTRWAGISRTASLRKFAKQSFLWGKNSKKIITNIVNNTGCTTYFPDVNNLNCINKTNGGYFTIYANDTNYGINTTNGTIYVYLCIRHTIDVKLAQIMCK